MFLNLNIGSHDFPSFVRCELVRILEPFFKLIHDAFQPFRIIQFCIKSSLCFIENSIPVALGAWP